MTIYFDNAATTFPKPEAVYEKVNKVMRDCANPGRSGHKMALRSGREIYKTRKLIAKIFSIDNPMQVVLTHSATEALNLAIKGVLEKGDHVIATSMEHNSVLRPLKILESNQYIELTIVAAENQGNVRARDIKNEIRNNTRLIIATHASNVVGTILPIKEIGQVARNKDILFLVDASQSAGIYDIDVNDMNIDLLAFPGHKGLFGPQGTGGLYMRKGIEPSPIVQGGTGSQSESLFQPIILPDKYESGTHNTVGIAGLGAGIEFILNEGIEKIRKHEELLTQNLIDGLSKINNITIYGTKNSKQQGAVVSFNIDDIGSSEIAFILDDKYNIACRSGLHCAPLAHKTLGTLDQGTVRVSLGYFNTVSEVDELIKAIKEITLKI